MNILPTTTGTPAKLLFTLSLTVISLVVTAQKKTLYDFKVNTIEGNSFDLSTLKGKKVLIVNTASRCGYTPQYEALQKLFETYGGDHFAILGFPANNFGGQEPGTNAEIRQFCTKNYGVTFPMMEKTDVEGKNIHPIFQWLSQKTENGVMEAPASWNFQKFMIDEKGQLVDFAPPSENPDSERIVKWIKSSS